jgi:hypothetical protein
VQPAVSSLDIEVSKTTIRNGQSIEFSIRLEPTIDLTILFDCGTSQTPFKILYIQQTIDLSLIPIGNCTYSTVGEYHPSVNAMNRVNSVNQSILIDVQSSLSPFTIEIEDNLNVNQLTLITIQALEPITFDGLFNLTITDKFNKTNQMKIERVQLLQSNNFTEQLYMNITTYGKQILYVRGGEFPTIRESQVTFIIGTEITTKPQSYILNPIGLVNEDLIWIDLQWINGIGFDIEIDYGNEKQVLFYYEQVLSKSFNRTMKRNDDIQWRKIAKQRLQVGYK